MTDTTAGVGHNQGPEDPFLASLEEESASLADRQMTLEMEAARLPREITTEEEAAKVTAWAARMDTLAKDTEDKRVAIKAPYLEKGKAIDAFFGSLRGAIKSRADGIRGRLAPYLAAKKAREEAEAKEKARIAREEAARRLREAEEARERAALAERRRQEEEARLRREEAERRDREARERREEEERQRAASAPVRESQTTTLPPATPINLNAPYVQPPPEDRTADEAEASLRLAGRDVGKANRLADRAAEDARKALLAADRLEKKAELGGAAKTTTGGASASLSTVWMARVVDFERLVESLGPLGPHLSEQAIRDAATRAARSATRPTVPGVEYHQETEVKASESRS